MTASALIATLFGVKAAGILAFAATQIKPNRKP